tara:strand:+ start:172 stop:474 length:303 start_codon:yes stop_codon:yes gene_type:complete
MKYLINFFIILILGLFLHSCTTIDKKANKAISKEEAELSKWLNQPVSELKIEFGKPDLIEETTAGKTFLVYKSKKYLIKCERKFEIKGEIVIGFSSSGCF